MCKTCNEIFWLSSSECEKLASIERVAAASYGQFFDGLKVLELGKVLGCQRDCKLGKSWRACEGQSSTVPSESMARTPRNGLANMTSEFRLCEHWSVVVWHVLH